MNIVLMNYLRNIFGAANLTERKYIAKSHLNGQNYHNSLND